MSIATKIRYGLVACALLLAACGGSLDNEERQEYIDKCIIEAGPRSDRDDVHGYCAAKWCELQREKAKDTP